MMGDEMAQGAAGNQTGREGEEAGVGVPGKIQECFILFSVLVGL
jgi:hypothetical protein